MALGDVRTWPLASWVRWNVATRPSGTWDLATRERSTSPGWNVPPGHVGGGTWHVPSRSQGTSSGPEDADVERATFALPGARPMVTRVSPGRTEGVRGEVPPQRMAGSGIFVLWRPIVPASCPGGTCHLIPFHVVAVEHRRGIAPPDQNSPADVCRPGEVGHVRVASGCPDHH